MSKLLMILAVPFVLIGCSHHYHPLDLGKKARVVAELVTPSPECKIFKDKLASPLKDDDAADLIFNDALKAHCIKSDV
jgi:hypothetical protein